MKTPLLTGLVLLATLAGSLAVASPARDLLDRRKALEDGERRWKDRHQRISGTLLGRPGGEELRELEIYEKRYPGGDPDQKQVVFFLAPVESKGTGFLSVQHKGGPAEQWLYTPKTNRLRVIAGNFRQQRFEGTDLTFHDVDLLNEMGSWTEADATSSLIADEVIDGVPCARIELLPKRDDIAYRKIMLWLGREDLFPRRLELFRDAGLTKRIEQFDITPVGKIPVAHRIVVETPADTTQTVLSVKLVEFDQDLEDDLFTTATIERGSR